MAPKQNSMVSLKATSLHMCLPVWWLCFICLKQRETFSPEASKPECRPSVNKEAVVSTKKQIKLCLNRGSDPNTDSVHDKIEQGENQQRKNFTEKRNFEELRP